MNVPLIVFVVVVDLVITAAVLWLVLSRKKVPFLRLLRVDVGQLKAFADAWNQRIGEYFRANYSGRPDELPEVLKGLLDELERDSQSRGLPFDRTMLRNLIRQWVVGQQLA